MRRRRRPAVLRVCVASIAGMVAALVLVTGAGAAEQVPFEEMDTKHVDVEVFMLVGATDRQIDRVEREIRSSAAVDRYAHLDQGDAMVEFRRIFRRNHDLVASIRPSDLPESFRVDVHTKGAARRLARRVQRLPGVEFAGQPDPPTLAELADVIRICQLHQDTDFEVFMRVDATQAELAATRAAIAAEPGLTITDELTKGEAYDEFRRIFASNPDLLRSIDSDDLPSSFRVRGTTTPSQALLDRLATLPGVELAEGPPTVCDDVRALLDQGVTPEQLARIFRSRALA